MARSYNDLGVEFKYLIVNDTDRKFGLYINTVGVQAIRPNSPYPIKDHPSGYLFNAKKDVSYASTNYFILQKEKEHSPPMALQNETLEKET